MFFVSCYLEFLVVASIRCFRISKIGLVILLKYDRNVRVGQCEMYFVLFYFQNLLIKDIIGIPRLGFLVCSPYQVALNARPKILLLCLCNISEGFGADLRRFCLSMLQC